MKEIIFLSVLSLLLMVFLAYITFKAEYKLDPILKELCKHQKKK